MKFTIPGEPKGKGRPRFVRQTGAAYTPKDTANYENLVKVCCMEAMTKQGWSMHQDGALEIIVWVYVQPPKSVSKKKMAEMLSGKIRPTKKPDWDNVGKLVADSLNKIAFHDDSQISDGIVRKRYAAEPRVEVEIREA